MSKGDIKDYQALYMGHKRVYRKSFKPSNIQKLGFTPSSTMSSLQYDPDEVLTYLQTNISPLYTDLVYVRIDVPTSDDLGLAGLSNQYGTEFILSETERKLFLRTATIPEEVITEYDYVSTSVGASSVTVTLLEEIETNINTHFEESDTETYTYGSSTFSVLEPEDAPALPFDPEAEPPPPAGEEPVWYTYDVTIYPTLIGSNYKLVGTRVRTLKEGDPGTPADPGDPDAEPPIPPTVGVPPTPPITQVVTKTIYIPANYIYRNYSSPFTSSKAVIVYVYKETVGNRVLLLAPSSLTGTVTSSSILLPPVIPLKENFTVNPQSGELDKILDRVGVDYETFTSVADDGTVTSVFDEPLLSDVHMVFAVPLRDQALTAKEITDNAEHESLLAESKYAATESGWFLSRLQESTPGTSPLTPEYQALINAVVPTYNYVALMTALANYYGKPYALMVKYFPSSFLFSSTELYAIFITLQSGIVSDYDITYQMVVASRDYKDKAREDFVLGPDLSVPAYSCYEALFKMFDLAIDDVEVRSSTPRLGMNYKYRVKKLQGPGSIGSVGTYTREVVSKPTTKEYTVTTTTYDKTTFPWTIETTTRVVEYELGEEDVLVFKHQVDATTVKTLEVWGFSSEIKIGGYYYHYTLNPVSPRDRGYLTMSGLRGAFSESAAYMPVSLDILDGLKFAQYLELREVSLNFFLFTKQTIKIAWYASGLFKFVIKVAAIVVAAISGNAWMIPIIVTSDLWMPALINLVMNTFNIPEKYRGYVTAALSTVLIVAGGFSPDAWIQAFQVVSIGSSIVNAQAYYEMQELIQEALLEAKTDEELRKELKVLEDKYSDDTMDNVNSIHNDTSFALTPNPIFRDTETFVRQEIEYLYAQFDSIFDPNLDKYTQVYTGP